MGTKNTLTNDSSPDILEEWQGILRVVWVFTLAAIVVLTCLPASSPAIEALDALPLSDKIEHLAAYLALAFLPALHERRRPLLVIGLFLAAMGVALEFCQLSSEGRTFSVGDMVADLAGVVIGMTLGLVARARVAIAAQRSLPEF